MNELIKIEFKKMKLKKQMKGLIIANIVIFLLLSMVFFMDGMTGIGMGLLHEIVVIIIQGTFIVWQAVLISSLIIEEFKTKTIAHLYTYPIKRSAIFISKILLIFMTMLAFSLITQLIQHSLFSIVAIILPQFVYTVGLQTILGIVLISLFTTLLAMTPLAVGLWMKSTLAPVVTSFIVLAFLTGDVEGALMNNLIALGITAIVGLIVTAMSIKDVMSKDLII
jgi:ABC-type transport system involved in multi-copper enzyme maturation permease subunit